MHSQIDQKHFFEQTTKYVMMSYKQVTGQDVDLNANPDIYDIIKIDTLSLFCF